jgi:hypothetical protein
VQALHLPLVWTLQVLLWRQLLAWLQSAVGLLLQWASWRVLRTRQLLAWLQAEIDTNL